ncbi:probable aspartic proteinase GIP2 [Magnolia sinica]|uniref:probable aspartic proteinase GIP2 n=1 Tax=Magnolia sinica TaxID=86752 RepID=UPI002658D22B|nr:probable aspartic proteinase GIP2 [Magnolia sinica]
MASSTPNVYLFSTLFLLLISFSFAQVSFRPKALILPVVKDTATLQYVTQINQRTPLLPIRLTVDLGGQFLWVDCDSAAYVSSSYRQARCGSAQCSLAKSGACGGGICGLFPDNTITRTGSYGEVGDDIVALQSTDGSNPGPIVTIPHFIFTCAPTFLLQGLASKVNGMVGLARTRIALPSQFAAAFSFHRKFAVCLSSSSTSNGVIFFGDGPYMLLPNIDASKSLIYTPLIINPVSTAGVYGLGEPSDEYFIGVKSIKINEKRVPLNASLLSIDNNGFGGTKISTVNPYTTLETSIYKAFSEAFIREATSRNITRAAPVAPFDVCFSSKRIGSTRVGPAVPWVDLVLQSENVYWRIFGANSMVYVNDDVVCLAFVDGGSNPRTSIVIGGYQLEDNLLQFDLATSRLGFSSSLLFRRTTCANFNFTSNV